MTLSLVICTFNRPDLVSQVLETVAQQDAPRDAYEVLVIDNASPTDVGAVVRGLDRRIPGLRYIREETVGLSHARNRGWREARGEYVGYVDDDCKLPPEWISTALGTIRAVRPVMLGGPYRAFYMTRRPVWYRDEYGAAGNGEEAGYLYDGMLSGGNMVIQREALAAVGGFDPGLGMTGATMAYGEETALQHALRAKYGPDCIYYDPQLYVYHLVRPEKMSVWWIMKRRYLGGLYGYRCTSSRECRIEPVLLLWTRAIRTALGFGWDVVRACFVRNRARFPSLQNYIWEQASYRLERLGGTMGAIGAARRRAGSARRR